MEIRKVTAIVRSTSLDEVERRLCDAGVCGFTVSPVRGVGEDRNFFARNPTLKHARIEVFAEREEAERIARLVIDAAQTGEAGDGIVAILPVERLLRIRTGREPEAGEL